MLTNNNAMQNTEHCERCGKQLVENGLVRDGLYWCELDNRTGMFRRPGQEPLKPEYSQGYFPFGSTCATKPNKPYAS